MFGTVQGVETKDPAFGLDAVWIQRAEHGSGLVLVRGRASERREHVHTQGQVPFQGHAARHVLDVGVEPPVLVDDDHRRAALTPLLPGQIPHHRGALSIPLSDGDL